MSIFSLHLLFLLFTPLLSSLFTSSIFSLHLLFLLFTPPLSSLCTSTVFSLRFLYILFTPRLCSLHTSSFLSLHLLFFLFKPAFSSLYAFSIFSLHLPYLLFTSPLSFLYISSFFSLHLLFFLFMPCLFSLYTSSIFSAKQGKSNCPPLAFPIRIFIPLISRSLELRNESLVILTSLLDFSKQYISVATPPYLKVRKIRVGHLLPRNSLSDEPCARIGGCVLAGDTRVNENTALAAMHTVWVRLHNVYAKRIDRLGKRRPRQFPIIAPRRRNRNKIIYEEARKSSLLYYSVYFMMNGFLKFLQFQHTKATSLM